MNFLILKAMKTSNKLLFRLLLSIYILSCYQIAHADGFTIELLDPNMTSDQENLLALNSFPLKSGQKNSKKEFYNDNRGAFFVKKKPINFDCLLRNSERWQVTDILGLNEQGELMAHIEHSDYDNSQIESYSQFHRTAILRRTGKGVEDYCPVVTYSINKECVNEVNKIAYNERLSYSIKSNKDVDWHTLPNISHIQNINVNCKIRLKIKDSRGRTIPNSNFLVSIKYGSEGITPKTHLISSGKTKAGKLEVNLKLLELLTVYYGQTLQEFGSCPFTDVKIQSPYLSEKWISKGITFGFYETCV